MGNFKYFLRSYKYDLLGTIVSAVSIVVAFYLNKIAALSVSVLIVFGALIFILYQKSKDKDFYFLSFGNKDDKDDWIGRRRFGYYRPQKCFVITDSESGYIFSKCLSWSDYKMSFNFKIVNSCLGVVLRAVNLSNYVMLQIRDNGIRPHIRINGGWRPWEAEESGLVFNDKLSPDKWYRGEMTCDKEILDIKIYERESNLIFSRQWTIPTGMMTFDFRESAESSKGTAIPFPINLEYGSMGFRNSGLEKALIKDFLVEKL